MTLYWCFICQQKFENSEDTIECPICHQQAFEECKEETKPETFEVYEERRPIQNNNQNQNQQLPNMQFFQVFGSTDPRELEAFGMQIFNNLPAFMNNVNGILHNLFARLQTSGRSYRPATRQEIDRLQRVQSPTQCSICQTQGSMQGYKLRCGHEFHTACLDPWLERANTCPTCRGSL